MVCPLYVFKMLSAASCVLQANSQVNVAALHDSFLVHCWAPEFQKSVAFTQARAPVADQLDADLHTLELLNCA